MTNSALWPVEVGGVALPPGQRPGLGLQCSIHHLGLANPLAHCLSRANPEQPCNLVDRCPFRIVLIADFGDHPQFSLGVVNEITIDITYSVIHRYSYFTGPVCSGGNA